MSCEQITDNSAKVLQIQHSMQKITDGCVKIKSTRAGRAQHRPTNIKEAKRARETYSTSNGSWKSFKTFVVNNSVTLTLKRVFR